MRVNGPKGPKVLRVLRFDSGKAAEGYGIALTGDKHKDSVTGLPSLLPLSSWAIIPNFNMTYEVTVYQCFIVPPLGVAKELDL